MTRSHYLYGRDLFDERKPIVPFIVALMGVANDISSCWRAWRRIPSRPRRGAISREAIESDDHWVIRLSIMHLWEAEGVLRRDDLHEMLIAADLPRLAKKVTELRRRIEAHPLLKLRSKVSAHYKPRDIAAGLRILREEDDPWMERFAEGTVGELAFKTPSAVFVAHAAHSLGRGDASNEEVIRAASGPAFAEMAELAAGIRAVCFELLDRLVSGRFDGPRPTSERPGRGRSGAS